MTSSKTSLPAEASAQAGWHSLPVENVLQLFKSNAVQGLTSGEAEQRRKTYGPNTLGEGKRTC